MEYLIAGIILGFVSGISPGPLLILVITETIKRNLKEGVKMAFVPLASDLPIVLFSVFVVSKISGSDLILAIISFLGAAFLLYLASENIRTQRIVVDSNKKKWSGFTKGILVNLLSPHPYLFWLLVGAPYVVKGNRESGLFAVLFILGFYVFIIGTKIIISVLTEKSKKIIADNWYIRIVKMLGIILIAFAIILIIDGFKYLGMLT
jgi:threonine/homoserine/homoserine lactone efflux protein